MGLKEERKEVRKVEANSEGRWGSRIFEEVTGATGKFRSRKGPTFLFSASAGHWLRPLEVADRKFYKCQEAISESAEARKCFSLGPRQGTQHNGHQGFGLDRLQDQPVPLSCWKAELPTTRDWAVANHSTVVIVHGGHIWQKRYKTNHR